MGTLREYCGYIAGVLRFVCPDWEEKLVRKVKYTVTFMEPVYIALYNDSLDTQLVLNGKQVDLVQI